MAPKRKRRDGYSDEGLRALESGTYGKETGRKAQFTSSEGQLMQSQTLPRLTGMKKVDTSTPTEVRPKTGTSRFDSGLNKSQEIPTLNKPSTRYQNQTAAEAAPAVSRDTTFDKDFDEFHKYRVGEYLDRRDYDPVTDQDVEHWRNLRQEIMAKNNWSEAEFDKRWEEYYTDRAQKEADQYVKNTVEFTKEHPIAGSLLSLADTAGTWIEGGATALEGLASLIAPEEFKQKYMRDKSTDPGFTYTRQRAAVREAVKDKISNPVAKFAYETAMGLPEMAAGPLAMATQTAGNMQMNALERGVERDRAAQTGTVGGVASYVANKVGFEKMLGAEASNIYSQIAKAGASEGLENVAEDIMNMVSDQIINQENSEVSSTFKYYKAQGMTDREAIRNTFTDYLKQAATSFGSGAIFGSLFNATNSVPELYGDIKNRLTDRKINSNEIVKGIKNGDIQSLVDNGPMTSYNNVAEGEINGNLQTGVTNDGTGSEAVLRGLRETGPVGAGKPRIGVSGGEYLPADRVPITKQLSSQQKILDDADTKLLVDNKIPHQEFFDANNSPETFTQALATAKANNEYGGAVEGHDLGQIQEIVNNGGQTFLVSDGSAGGAVTSDGNLTCVFKDPLNNDTKQMGSAIALASVKKGAKKADCFGRFLVNTYSKAGFEPVGRVAYTFGIPGNEDMDATVRRQLQDGIITRPPDVYALKLRDGYTFDEATRNYNTAKKYTQAELDALPLYEGPDAYDDMLANRDAMLAPQEVPQQPVVDPAARRNQLAELTQTIEQKRAELNQIPQVNKAERQARYDELQALQQQAKDIVSGKAVPELVAQSAPVEDEAPFESTDEELRMLGVDPERVRSASTSAPVEVDPANVIYHSGILSRRNKAESRGMMHEGSRNTGYFGTGHYFVDNAHRGEIDNNSNYNVKPYTSVDISKYGNLYKADTDAKAEKLHGFSEDYTRYVNTHNDSKYYTDADGHIDEEARAEYLDDLYKTFRELFPEQPTTKEQFINQINAFRESEYDVDLSDMDDSVFTQLMKSMGYNGVDTTGTRFADTRYGTVIYDLDEDSILQSNVTDAEVKKGLMNTRVRNEGQDVFDTAEDEKIQKSLDAVSKRRAIGEEYYKLFDEPSFRQLKAELEETKKYLDRNRESLEEDTYTLNNPDAFAEKVEEHKRTLKKYHLESETDEEAIQTVRYELEYDIEDTKELIAQREQRVKELQASVDEMEKASKAAYAQAKAVVEGNAIPQESVDNAVAAEVGDEIEMLNNTGLEKPEYDPNDFIITETVEPAGEGSKREGYSQVATNSLVNAGIIDASEIDNNPVVHEMAKSATKSNDVSFNAAFDNVKQNGATILDNIINDRAEINSDQTVDEAFILLQDLNDKIDQGDQNALNQKYLLMERLIKAGQRYGRMIQAFAKWNDTPEGLIVNSKSILQEQTDAAMSRNQGQHEKHKKIAEEIVNITNGPGYSKPKEKVNQSNATLDSALRKQGYDGTMEQPKAPKTHEEIRAEVENSIRKEFGSVADQFADNDFEYLTSLVENKIPTEIIVDELEHRLNHGEWYTIDESTPVKKATSSKLSRVLKNMGNDALKAKNMVPKLKGDINYPEKSHATIAEEVRNTLASDPASVELDNPNDVEFITNMLENGASEWQIEDEISHRLMFGEWYPIEAEVKENKPRNQKIQNALNSLVEEGEVPEKPELTHEELVQQIRNTLDEEPASSGISRLYTDQGEYTDQDVEYLANLIENGATTEEIANALDTKLSTGTFDISQDAQNKINMLFEYARHYDPNSKEACQAKAAAYQIAANEVVGKASAFEKFEAWRYLAMLGNPKTMLRNILGNNLWGATTGVKNTLAAVIEAAADRLSKNGIDRTKAVLNPFGKADKALISRSKADGDEHRYVQLDSQKYEKMSVKDRIKAEKSVFNSKLMQLYENATDAGISDYRAVKRKYGTSLAGWLKANGYDESIFDADEAYRVLKDESRRRVLSNAERANLDNLKQYHDTLEKARDYAVQQAEYATFHEDNAFAQALSRSSNFLINNDKKSLRALGYMLEGVVPFKKTPANILKSGMEMSPLGIFSSVGKSLKYAYENTGRRKGNLADEYTKTSLFRKNESTVKKTTASELIDSWAKTLTGSGLAALGYYLSSKGILNLSNKDEKYQDQLEGTQNYSITINGKNFTIDWAAPAAMPLLLGAAVHNVFERNAITDKKFYENADELIGTINAVLDPVFETSMMSGVKDTLNTAANEIKYNDDSAVGGILGALATNAITGYATQAVPTVLGQVARVIDPTRRATDTATEGFIGGVEKQGRKMMNKLPWLSFLNPAYIDARGQEQNNSPSRNPLLSLPYQMLSPSYITDVNQTPADKMARDVFYGKDADGKPILDSDVFPAWSSTVRANGEKLTPKQMEAYRRKSGTANEAIRTALSGQQWFDEMDATKQTNLLKSINNLVKKIGLEDYTDASGKDYEAYKKGGVPALMDYYKGQQIGKQIEEKTGLSASSNAYKEIKNDLLAGNQKAADEKLKEYSVEQPMMEKAEEIDVSPQRYKQIVKISGDNAEKVEADLPKLKELGAVNDDLTTYARAVTYDENLTPEKWKSKYDEMNTDTSNILKQDEIIDYANKKKLSLPQLQELWNLYASGTDGEAPKSQPYIKKDGTFGRHTKK